MFHEKAKFWERSLKFVCFKWPNRASSCRRASLLNTFINGHWRVGQQRGSLQASTIYMAQSHVQIQSPVKTHSQIQIQIENTKNTKYLY